MRESRTYGSGRGACHEMHVPTATCARQSWCDPAGGSPAQVRSSVRLVASVAWPAGDRAGRATAYCDAIAMAEVTSSDSDAAAKDSQHVADGGRSRRHSGTGRCEAATAHPSCSHRLTRSRLACRSLPAGRQHHRYHVAIGDRIGSGWSCSESCRASRRRVQSGRHGRAAHVEGCRQPQWPMTARRRARQSRPSSLVRGEADALIIGDALLACRAGDRRAGGAASHAGDLSAARVRRGRRADDLRTELSDPYRQAATMSTASSRARSRPTCRCSSRPSSSWSSISRPPRRSASTCRPRCSPAPTR